MIRVSLSLGGSDRASIKFLKKWPRGFYVSPLVDNFDSHLQDFLIKQCFTDGAALFGRETPYELQQVREWARGRLDAVPDREVYYIVQYFVQRVRNYVHIRSLSEAEISSARSSGCHESRIVDVERSRVKIREMRRLSLMDYRDQVYGKDLGFPPYSIECTCRLEGLIAGVGY